MSIQQIDNSTITHSQENPYIPRVSSPLRQSYTQSTISQAPNPPPIPLFCSQPSPPQQQIHEYLKSFYPDPIPLLPLPEPLFTGSIKTLSLNELGAFLTFLKEWLKTRSMHPFFLLEFKKLPSFAKEYILNKDPGTLFDEKINAELLETLKSALRSYYLEIEINRLLGTLQFLQLNLPELMTLIKHEKPIAPWEMITNLEEYLMLNEPSDSMDLEEKSEDSEEILILKMYLCQTAPFFYDALCLKLPLGPYIGEVDFDAFYLTLKEDPEASLRELEKTRADLLQNWNLSFL